MTFFYSKVAKYKLAMQEMLYELLRSITRGPSDHFTQVEEARTARELIRAVNKLQSRLWKLPQAKQLFLRKKLTTALCRHTLYASQASLRLEAANWLRLLVQSALVTQPGEIFATLVTVAVKAFKIGNADCYNECRGYLKIIFDCFWPFRPPYAAFPSELFPANEVFYPLAPLLLEADTSIQKALLVIFAELPRLDDTEIVEHLLPVALAWSTSTDPEQRRSVISVLARLSHAQAHEALNCLQSDPDPLVSSSARRSAAKIQSV